MKFATIYLPGTIKDIRLYFRKELGPGSFLDNHYNKKVLVKQSYILLIWLHYLSSKYNVNTKNVDDELGNTTEEEVINIPKFFIYPKKNYKTTIQKAPMAHKTFSQEQYMIRYYTLSISFLIKCKPDRLSLKLKKKSTNIYPIKGINYSLYYGTYLFYNMPYFSTNLFWLKKYTVTYVSCDNSYFSYSLFKKFL